MTDHALAYVIEGKLESDTVVFIHGWPDSMQLWDQQVAHLTDRFRIVRVRTNSSRCMRVCTCV